MVQNQPGKPAKTAVLSGKVIKLTFQFDRDLIDRVKTIEGRRYNDKEKYWTVPVSEENIKTLQMWGFSLSKELQDVLTPKKPVNEIQEIEIPKLKGTLYPFQNIGVSFIESRNGRALVADEMGLGKTLQSISWISLHPELRPAVVVCPASLKLNWLRELLRWLPNPEAEVLSGTKPYTPRGKILIVNYDILTYWTDALMKRNPKVLVLDEIHFAKSNTARRTKAVKRLGKSIPHVIGLSGTPIVNRPVEIYNAISLIAPVLFPDPWAFYQRYCGAKHNGFGWDFTGATHTDELHQKLSETIMIRRLKRDVLTELPDKQYSFQPMELSNEREYRFAERDFIEWLRKEKGATAAQRAKNAEALVKIEGLKQLCAHGKLQSVVDWIRDFLDVDGKLVVFAHHRFVVEALEREFKDISVSFVGGMSATAKNEAEQRFQKDPNVRLFIGNIDAAGVGLTLTAASNAAFIELPWTPGALAQASDRIHRIGQKDAVTIHYLFAVNTIDEKMAIILDAKRRVLDSVLDGKLPDRDTLLTELINSYIS